LRKISELMDLSGRRAILVGGAGHIGLGAAETLWELGANIALLDIDLDTCERRAQEMSGRRAGSACAVYCDLLQAESAVAAIQGAIQLLGGADILINCAGYVGTTKVRGWAVPFEQQTTEAFEEALFVNLTAAFVMAKEARSSLQQSGHGSIILFLSTYAMVGPDPSLYVGTEMANPVGYGASKGGLLQLTRYLATTFAPTIRVNAISPGGVWRGYPETFHERYKARTPLKRMAVEEDLKGAIAFLASDLSAYVTGHNLVVDGGWTAW